MIIQHHSHDIATNTGVMRTSIYRPVEEGKYPCVIFYSEIFQETAPIARSAAILAGHGFVVLVPEVFHELNPIGTVLAYDDAGKDKGNADKWAKPLESHDSDTDALITFARQQDYCTGNVGAMGVCIGGHLAYRAALNPSIKAAFCLYATDIHSDTLPAQAGNNSFERMADIKGEIHFPRGAVFLHGVKLDRVSEGRVHDGTGIVLYRQTVGAGVHFKMPLWGGVLVNQLGTEGAFADGQGKQLDLVGA